MHPASFEMREVSSIPIARLLPDEDRIRVLRTVDWMRRDQLEHVICIAWAARRKGTSPNSQKVFS